MTNNDSPSVYSKKPSDLPSTRGSNDHYSPIAIIDKGTATCTTSCTEGSNWTHSKDVSVANDTVTKRVNITPVTLSGSHTNTGEPKQMTSTASQSEGKHNVNTKGYSFLSLVLFILKKIYYGCVTLLTILLRIIALLLFLEIIVRILVFSIFYHEDHYTLVYFVLLFCVLYCHWICYDFR